MGNSFSAALEPSHASSGRLFWRFSATTRGALRRLGWRSRFSCANARRRLSRRSFWTRGFRCFRWDCSGTFLGRYSLESPTFGGFGSSSFRFFLSAGVAGCYVAEALKVGRAEWPLQQAPPGHPGFRRVIELEVKVGAFEPHFGTA